MYHLTAVSNPSKGLPSFWATGWLGPQQYLTYSSLRHEADPCGAWMWENQLPGYWEKETTDLRSKEQLFLEALRTLKNQINGQKEGWTAVAWVRGRIMGLNSWVKERAWSPRSEGGGLGLNPRNKGEVWGLDLEV